MKFKITGLSLVFVAVFGTIFTASSVSSETGEVSQEVVAKPEAVVESEASAEFIWPQNKERISCDYDCYNNHLVVDFSEQLGADVLASKAATVIETGYDKLGNGYYVLLDHGDGARQNPNDYLQ